MKLAIGLTILTAYTSYFVCAKVVVTASSSTSAVPANGIATVTTTGIAWTPSDVIIHPIHCYCDLIYEPVCGSNGVTYSNECVMSCVSTEHVNNGRPPVHLIHRGKCRILTYDCPQIVDPVCSTNNQTFHSDCSRIYDNTYHTDKGLPPLYLAYNDFCKPSQCFCPDAVVPVCGTNSKTYRNICYLQCCSRVNLARGLPVIHVEAIGACRNETCSCPPIQKQICASDGNTYFNKCGLDCQNRRRDQLGLEPIIFLYPGECIKCVCSANIDPVCGSDGETYSNYCLLLCENRTRKRQGLPELTARWRGPCDCGCFKQYKPVCASDRDTWNTRCLLDCENRKRALSGQPRLTVLYDGECRVCSCEYCPNRYNPVCGSDNQTYQNTCFLKCINSCRINDGMLPIWEIAARECYR